MFSSISEAVTNILLSQLPAQRSMNKGYDKIHKKMGHIFVTY